MAISWVESKEMKAERRASRRGGQRKEWGDEGLLYYGHDMLAESLGHFSGGMVQSFAAGI